MNIKYLTKSAVNAFIDAALKEDLGDGDHSTLAAIPEDLEQEAKLLIKGDGVIAGLTLAEWIFHRFDESLEVTLLKKDGQEVQEGEIGLMVKGKARSILSTERLVLNCMQRMSGIATYTRKLTEMIRHTETKLLDTRKTAPNFRLCEKWAVQIGGGVNHRFGLYDMVMLKDNHIDYAGGITQAVSATKSYLNKKGKELRIEVETRNINEVREALEVGGVDVIMLDNMLPSMMREAIQIIDGQCSTEASGGVTEKNIKEIAETGVDFISVGALTHSYSSMDISLKAVNKK
ncbi:nicotinate-nucleotide diphosphorylase (carboxylating) [Reichenbachiella sp. 5M10]|uniref:carboxylating nicotinate-nucleotide diphosphorylase n=1 Tax=Reichenbachiella sp. 5M10 TaxID=1889772 RepID=UPI000C15B600|nr:carboxylating nicotinate-nucleotide diphosphorylase [Reichenbachiella sp. 5M10]PIB36584.1 nicotinate-nucleotide diphosphorylase (carboxylating) [Reichenbachiella sp. 5M10]